MNNSSAAARKLECRAATQNVRRRRSDVLRVGPAISPTLDSMLLLVRQQSLSPTYPESNCLEFTVIPWRHAQKGRAARGCTAGPSIARAVVRASSTFRNLQVPCQPATGAPAGVKGKQNQRHVAGLARPGTIGSRDVCTSTRHRGIALHRNRAIQGGFMPARGMVHTIVWHTLRSGRSQHPQGGRHV